MSSLNYDCMEIIINKCDFSTLKALYCIWEDEYLSDEWDELLEPCVGLYRNMKAERERAHADVEKRRRESHDAIDRERHRHYPNPHGYGF
jgi:hypothetical protein